LPSRRFIGKNTWSHK